MDGICFVGLDVPSVTAAPAGPEAAVRASAAARSVPAHGLADA